MSATSTNERLPEPERLNLSTPEGRLADIEQYLATLPEKHREHEKRMQQSDAGSIEFHQQFHPGMTLGAKLDTYGGLLGLQPSRTSGKHSVLHVIPFVPSLKPFQEDFDRAVLQGASVHTVYEELKNRGLEMIWTDLADHAIEQTVRSSSASKESLVRLAKSFDTPVLKDFLLENLQPYFRYPGNEKLFTSYTNQLPAADPLRRAWERHRRIETSRSRTQVNVDDLLGD